MPDSTLDGLPEATAINQDAELLIKQLNASSENVEHRVSRDNAFATLVKRAELGTSVGSVVQLGDDGQGGATMPAVDASNLRGITKTFDVLNDLLNSTDVKVGDVVRILGRFVVGDTGANTYEIVAPGTGTPDGGTYINLIGVNAQAYCNFANKIYFSKQFGALHNDSSDETSYWTNLITALPSTGAKVYISEGVTRVSSINVTNKEFHLCGVVPPSLNNENTSTVKGIFSSVDIINVNNGTGHNCSFKDFEITSHVARNSGGSIDVTTTGTAAFSNVILSRGVKSINVNGATWGVMHRCVFRSIDTAAGSSHVTLGENSRVSNFTITDCYFILGATSTQIGDCILLRDFENVQIDNCLSGVGTYFVNLNTKTGTTSESLRVFNNYTSAVNQSVLLYPEFGGTCNDITIARNRFKGDGALATYGVNLLSDNNHRGILNGVDISENTITDMLQRGILINGFSLSAATISKNKIAGSGVEAIACTNTVVEQVKIFDNHLAPFGTYGANFRAFSQYAGGGCQIYGDKVSGNTNPILEYHNPDLWFGENVGHSGSIGLPVTLSATSGTITSYTILYTNFNRKGNEVKFDVRFQITTNGTGANTLRLALPYSSAGIFVCHAVRESPRVAMTAIKTGSGTTFVDLNLYDATYPGVDGGVYVVQGTFSVS